ncbi:MAG: Phosphatidylserine decarboxylase proenzyme [Candidatus Scalindua arabica]|uniref:Phosphatidylserine decarboxylase proenzyme n=1 Tax=Candidatus Scalindua arabica TaxID=1127984 RepID=A0A941W3U6_9BACT|nr:Phosphatidylserine decarboxylase proenzyme [Candidatus Scalindua arabica]
MRFPFAEYGSKELSFFGMFFFVLIVLSLFFYPLVVIPISIFLFFVFYFFRDPNRNPPEGEEKLLAPADGRIISISYVQEDNYLKCKAVKIATFMSLFSVHVNRISYSGKVEFIKHVPGKFLDARSPKASEMNEHNLMGIITSDGKTKIMIKQVAGKVARRIVCDCSIGQDVERGRRFGMIKFGSRLEVYIPEDADFEIAVKEGDMVSAGTTVLGILKGKD